MSEIRARSTDDERIEAMDVRVEYLARSAEAAAEWDAYVDRQPRAAVYHLSGFRDFIESATGHAAHYLLARSLDGCIVGVLPLIELKSRLFGHYFVSLPYFNHCGIVANDEWVCRALREGAADAVARTRANHVEIRQLGALNSMPWPARSVKDEMMLSLPESADALMAGFRSKLRSQIRRPQKEGVSARVGGGELLDSFYLVFARNMRDLGTPVYARSFFEKLFAHFADRLWIVVCELRGAPVAAGIVIGWRDVMEIPWASSLRESASTSANMLLYWTALAFSMERGCRRFDFGRSTRGSGTWKFKEQWGAVPTPLHWYYFLRAGDVMPELNPQNPKYRVAIEVWRRLPVAITNRLGPLLVKNLP